MISTRNEKNKMSKGWKLHPKSEDSQQLYLSDEKRSSKAHRQKADQDGVFKNNTK